MRTPTEFQIGQLMHRIDSSKVKPPQGVVKSSSEDQKKELAASIRGLETKLKKLEAHIKTREQETASGDPNVTAKKARTAKETIKPKTVAEQAKIDRVNKKLAGVQTSKATPKRPVSELKPLATKVRGQIAVAKQKLAAL